MCIPVKGVGNPAVCSPRTQVEFDSAKSFTPGLLAAGRSAKISAVRSVSFKMTTSCSVDFWLASFAAQDFVWPLSVLLRASFAIVLRPVVPFLCRFHLFLHPEITSRRTGYFDGIWQLLQREFAWAIIEIRAGVCKYSTGSNAVFH